MSVRYFFASLTRISDLSGEAFEVEKPPGERRDNGDYAVAEVTDRRSRSNAEMGSGRMIELVEGLTGPRALNVRERASLPALDRLLERCPGLDRRPGGAEA